MVKHTRIPYLVELGDGRFFIVRRWERDVVDAGMEATFGSGLGAHIADVEFHVGSGVATMAQAKANAEFLALAANYHDALVGALKDAVQGCPCSVSERISGHRSECFSPDAREVLDAILQAKTPKEQEPDESDEGYPGIAADFENLKADFAVLAKAASAWERWIAARAVGRAETELIEAAIAQKDASNLLVSKKGGSRG
jgi:hypothetical protein